MKNPYFLYDPNGDGVQFFATQEERDQAAKDIIEECLDGGEWGAGVDEIVAGVVTHKSTKVDILKRPPDEEIDDDGLDLEGNYWGDYNERCNFELKPIDPQSPLPPGED
jgi:hypothetical protein